MLGSTLHWGPGWIEDPYTKTHKEHNETYIGTSGVVLDFGAMRPTLDSMLL